MIQPFAERWNELQQNIQGGYRLEREGVLEDLAAKEYARVWLPNLGVRTVTTIQEWEALQRVAGVYTGGRAAQA